ncbi:guanylate binding 5 isoform X1 [Pelobates cultripes]|uniref:Guanylate binding 5 isoform X1 n=1 Tax=Pelobates cultripes TaxID=61616 RepID=A0AAD1T718_PELCU|nr:guanylate binding 5 isoform X1 [Pelobates cultripes]
MWEKVEKTVVGATRGYQCLRDTRKKGTHWQRQGSSKNDNWIFSLAVLLSSTLVYNSVGTIDQESMEKLHCVTELTEFIKLKSAPTKVEDDESSEFKRYFPNFIWCVRDFCLKLEKENKEITQDEYLQNALKLKKGYSKSVSEYNCPRECITHFFHSHKCFVFPHPASTTNLHCLEDLTEAQLEEAFVEQVKKFSAFVYETSKPKTLAGGLTVTGRMLGNLAASYVTSIQSGSIPCLENAVVNLAVIENAAAIQDGVSLYEYEMKQRQNMFPVEQYVFMKFHRECEEKAVEVFLKRSFKDDERKYQLQLMVDVNQRFEHFCRFNEEASEKKCRTIIQGLSINWEQRIQNGDFCKPGGYNEFVIEKQRLVDEYLKINGKGIKAKEILEEFLGENQKIETSILHLDNSLHEKEKEMEKQKIENETVARKLQLEEEKEMQMEKTMNELKKNFEQQALMLKKKLEDERTQMIKENIWLIEQKTKEREMLEKQGFHDKAKMVNKEAQDLQNQNKSPDLSIFVNAIGVLAEAASHVLPGIYGKAALFTAKVLKGLF